MSDLRKNLAKLEADRAGKPNYLAQLVNASSESEMLALYNKHRRQLGELRSLDLSIKTLRDQIACES